MHGAKKIDFREAFDFSWEIIREKWSFLLGVWGCSFLISLPFMVLSSMWESRWYTIENGQRIATSQSAQEMFFYSAFQILYWLVMILVSYNVLKINLNILHKKEASVKDVFILPTTDTFRYLGAGIVYFVMVVVGLICFIVPGIYFAIKYMYVFNLIADEGMTIKEAAEKSAKMLEGNYWKIIGFQAMLLVTSISFIIVGLLCLLVGVIPAAFIAGWVITFSGLFVYNKLK